jgi:hypothetical protein
MVSMIPDAEAVPAAPWIFHGLEDLLFFVHILFVDALLGLCLAALASRIRRGTGVLHGFVESPIKVAPVMFALTVTFGVAPLLFTQVLWGSFFYTSSVLMGVFWILVIPLIIAGYYALYERARCACPEDALPTASIALTTCVLIYIGFMLSSNVTMMLTPESWSAYGSNRGGTVLPLANSSLYPRFLHFAVGAFAVGGLVTAVVNRIRKKGDGEGRAQAARVGLRIFAIATCVELVVGCWFLFGLPRDFVAEFTGGQAYPTLVLVIGIVAGIAAVVTAFTSRFGPTLVLAPLAVFSMVLTRDALRQMYLAPYFSESSLAQSPQYDVFALFLLILAVGAALVVWMIRAGFRPANAEAKQ